MSRFLRNSPRFHRPLPRFPACLAGRHSRQGRSVSASVSHPPSCTPFAPSPLRDFLATMGALTPAGHSPTMGQVCFSPYPSACRASHSRESGLRH